LGSSSNHASNEGRRQRPIARTRFIGRDEELRRLTQLVPDERLVTLLGVGGVGKTRLILEAIPRVRERFAGGVEVVELAGLTDPNFLLVAIAAAVGVRASSTGDLVDAFQERFQEPTLVVLDNSSAFSPRVRACRSCSTCARLSTSLSRAGPRSG
jgi:non-specific serine/threonine protein kinase